jgi:hypothetical protein
VCGRMQAFGDLLIEEARSLIVDMYSITVIAPALGVD